jgi:hypothetical protein
MSVDLLLTLSSIVPTLLRLGLSTARATLSTITIGLVGPFLTVALERRQVLGDKPTQ